MHDRRRKSKKNEGKRPAWSSHRGFSLRLFFSQTPRFPCLFTDSVAQLLRCVSHVSEDESGDTFGAAAIDEGTIRRRTHSSV